MKFSDWQLALVIGGIRHEACLLSRVGGGWAHEAGWDTRIGGSKCTWDVS